MDISKEIKCLRAFLQKNRVGADNQVIYHNILDILTELNHEHRIRGKRLTDLEAIAIRKGKFNDLPEELKPCPFCRSTILTEDVPDNSNGMSHIICSNCGASSSFHLYQRELHKAWNRRS